MIETKSTYRAMGIIGSLAQIPRAIHIRPTSLSPGLDSLCRLQTCQTKKMANYDGRHTNAIIDPCHSRCRRSLVGRATSAVSLVTMLRPAPRRIGYATTVCFVFWHPVPRLTMCARLFEDRQATEPRVE